jgi:HD-like signal output (HDOD) protein
MSSLRAMGRLNYMIIPDAVSRIPPFPRAAVDLLHRIPLASSQTYEVADLVANEPDWAAEIVRLANPESLGNFEPGDVLASIDTDELARLAIVAAGHTYIRDMARSELQRYWRYSIACAIASDELARFSKVNRALAYSGALLHDVGRLALMSAYPEQYANLVMLTERMFAVGEPFEISEYERTLFGMDRFSIAEWLAESWDLPLMLRPVVTRYQAAERSDELDLLTLVLFGCKLANALGYGLTMGAPRLQLRSISSQLPKPIQARWTDFSELPATVVSRLQKYGDPAGKMESAGDVPLSRRRAFRSPDAA